MEGEGGREWGRGKEGERREWGRGREEGVGEWGSGGGGEGEKRIEQERVGEENPQKCSSYVILTASKK